MVFCCGNVTEKFTPQGEPTHCLSCSDKIARWTVVGLQGALLSRLVEPVYLSSVVVSEMYNEEALRRALVERTESLRGRRYPHTHARTHSDTDTAHTQHNT